MFPQVIFLMIIAFNGAKALDKECVFSSYSDLERGFVKCPDVVIQYMTVPANKTLRLDLSKGTRLRFRGVTTFEFSQWTGPLVSVTGENLLVEGEKGSLLDGKGPLHWDGKGGGKGATLKPAFFKISAKDSVLKNMNLLNCPHNCVSIVKSENVIINQWKVDCSAGERGVAPKGHEGRNTDGFGASRSKNIIIENSWVHNQDDCIVINSGTDMLFRNITCIGSHGLSISMGKSRPKANQTHSRQRSGHVAGVFGNVVANVTFENSVVKNSANGIHIKTKPGDDRGEISNVTYRNIKLSGITNFGIEIHQDYGDVGHAMNNIPIRNLVIENVTGKVGRKARPVFINCARNGCFDWRWSGVNITHDHKKGPHSSCNFHPQGYQCK